MADGAASAGVLYSNITPTTFKTGWAIDYYWDYDYNWQGVYRISNSFTLTGNATVTGFDFVAWVDSDQVVNTIDWSIGTGEGLGDIASGTAATVANSLISQQPDYGIDLTTVSLGGLSLPLAGGATYWLTIGDAIPSDWTAQKDGRVGWDESDGPSAAWQDGRSLASNLALAGHCADGTTVCTGSEAFEILGADGGDPTHGGATPEPGSLGLIGFGALAMAAGLRRKLR